MTLFEFIKQSVLSSAIHQLIAIICVLNCALVNTQKLITSPAISHPLTDSYY